MWEQNTLFVVWANTYQETLNAGIEHLPWTSQVVLATGNDEEFRSKLESFIQVVYFRSETELPQIEIDFRALRSIKILRLGKIGAFRAVFSVFVREIERKYSEYWKNNPTALVLGNRWIGNIARTLRYLEPSYLPRPLPTVDRPVLLIGAGPSLNTSFSTIKELASQYYLLCVDTALPVLLERGIEPDGLVILEAQYWNSHDFLPLDKDYLGTRKWDIFADLTSFPGIRELFPRSQRYMFSSKFYPSQFFNALDKVIPVIPALGNVSVVGLYLSIILAKNEISIFGVDFGTRFFGEVVKGGHHHRWLLLTNDRFAYYSLPSSQVSKIQGRDFSLFSQLAEASGKEIHFNSEVRPEWKPEKGKQIIEISRDFYRESPVSTLVSLLRSILSTGEYFASNEAEQLSPGYWEFFRSVGSLLLIPAPGSISLEQVEVLMPYLKRSLFELRRGLGE